MTDYDRAIILEPGVADPWARRGLIKLRLGRQAEAQGDFNQCLRLKPDLKEALGTLVRAERLQLAARR